MLDLKHNTLLRNYEQSSLQSAELEKANIAMSEEIIKNAERTITIEDIEKYRQENELLRKKNIHLM
jgi:hypothetical protein